MKHFYFNHLVGILEKKKKQKTKSVFPTRHVLCIGSRRRISSMCWHRDGPMENWMYRTLWETYGTYYLNVWEGTFIIFFSSQILLFWVFLQFFFFHHCSRCSMKKQKQTNLKSSSYFVTKSFEVMDPCCCLKWFSKPWRYLFEHHNKNRDVTNYGPGDTWRRVLDLWSLRTQTLCTHCLRWVDGCWWGGGGGWFKLEKNKMKRDWQK